MIILDLYYTKTVEIFSTFQLFKKSCPFICLLQQISHFFRIFSKKLFTYVFKKFRTLREIATFFVKIFQIQKCVNLINEPELSSCQVNVKKTAREWMIFQPFWNIVMKWKFPVNRTVWTSNWSEEMHNFFAYQGTTGFTKHLEKFDTKVKFNFHTRVAFNWIPLAQQMQKLIQKKIDCCHSYSESDHFYNDELQSLICKVFLWNLTFYFIFNRLLAHVDSCWYIWDSLSSISLC